MVRPKLARYIGAGICGESYTCSRITARRWKPGLRNGTCGGVARDAPCRGRAFACPGIPGDYRARQGMPQAGSEAPFCRAVIMQIFMQRSSHGMFDGRFYSVGRQTGADPLSETRRTASPLMWLIPQMRHACPGRDT